jgi:hypothetical protein
MLCDRQVWTERPAEKWPECGTEIVVQSDLDDSGGGGSATAQSTRTAVDQVRSSTVLCVQPILVQRSDQRNGKVPTATAESKVIGAASQVGHL